MFDSNWVSHELHMPRQYLDMNGKRHCLLADAAIATGKVTLNKDFLGADLKFVRRGTVQRTQLGNTIFKEIKVAPPFMTKNVQHYAQNRNPWGNQVPPIETLMDILESDWDSDKVHVCFHSSGWDSRLLSGVLMKLREKNGEGWIGRLVFVCWEPEIKVAREILRWEGWKKSQIYGYKEGIGVDYRKELVDFKKVWKWVNSYNVPSLVAGPSIEEVKAKMNVKEVYSISGQYGSVFILNELRHKTEAHKSETCANPLVSSSISYLYYNRIYGSMWSAVEPVKFPHMDIRVLSSLSIPEGHSLKNEGEARRRTILKEISEELAEFPNIRRPDAWAEPYWIHLDRRLSKPTKRKIARDFNNSWFVKTFHQARLNEAPELGDRNVRWWRTYVLASLCEHLVNQGVTIKRW